MHGVRLQRKLCNGTNWPVMQPAVPLHNRTKEMLGCISGHPVT